MTRALFGLLILGAVVFLALAQREDAAAQTGAVPVSAPSAPDFPEGLDWLNVERPLTLADLQGKIVLLDFLTYGCINCIHVIPDLHALEEKYPDELVVIGVHSAKFDQEGETENIRRFVERYEITHPMVNDNEFEIWQRYRINAWPSFVLIDSEGRIAGGHVGEGVYEALDGEIASQVRLAEERGTLDRGELTLLSPGTDRPGSPLRFPGNVLAQPAADRLFIADTSHHRIVVTTLEGEVRDVIGSGEPGFVDGPSDSARFLRPQGMALADDETLFIADSGNHSIRQVDLASGEVTTVAGTGEQEYMFGKLTADGSSSGLNSPWDLHYRDGWLYIAMAGQHQLWRLDPASQQLELYAGSGFERLVDGPRLRSGLNQPTGLTAAGDRLFVADSEASAIRSVESGELGEVTTLVGTGLFDFGDVDGLGDRVRLEHPADLAFVNGFLYLSDTYNNKIKRLDPATREVVTVFGNGEGGWRDGSEPLFFEPTGISAAEERLFIADTNNHAVRVANLESGEVHTLTLSDPDRLLSFGDAETFNGRHVDLERQSVAAGDGQLTLTVTLPRGYKVNTLAPFRVDWSVTGEAVTIAPGRAGLEIAQPEYPLTIEVPAFFDSGEATVTAQVTSYYCREGAEALCLVDRAEISVPVVVQAGGDSAVRLERRPPAVPGN